MNTRRTLSILLLAASTGACDQVVDPATGRADTAMKAPLPSQAIRQIDASGQFTQTGITSLEVRSEGGNTIIEQTSEGLITGTLSGPFQDDLTVVIHADGSFTAHFTISCECTVDGQEGVVEMAATDNGELISPDVATFAGRAAITSGTEALSGLGGLLRIEGTVDVPSGLSTYTYEGTVRFTR